MVGKTISEEERLKELDTQLTGILEERFEIARRLHKREMTGVLENLSDRELVVNSKNVFTEIFNKVFKEFERKAEKYNIKSIVASGPVIIEDGKLLVNKDSKDDFYKIPGGTVEPDSEDLEEACHRETKEENNAEIEIVKPLHPMLIWKNPQTGEKMAILLIHYEAKLLNKEGIKPMAPVKEVRWLDIEEIKQGKYDVAPNIKFLIEKGDIKSGK